MSENNYILGLGKTSLGVAKDKQTETYYLTIEELIIQEKVGVNLSKDTTPSTNKTRIYVKNLEGLAVLENMVKDIKEKIKKQNRL